MNNSDRNLNLTIVNESEKKDEVLISIGSIFRYIKKYFLTWVIIAVIIFVGTFGFATFKTILQKPSLVALVSFTYSGIEKGLDPSGRKFDVNSLKNPSVIQMALDQMGFTVDELTAIRESITVEGIIPEDAIDRITAYKNVYENANTGNLSAAQAMLDVTYYPTTYKVYFDYGNTSFSRKDAVQVFNTILECYQDYFYDTYGYNESLGNSVNAIDIDSYDYSEAVDVIQSSLTSLRKYVKQISDEDSTRFRSAVTGYTFDDLYDAIGTVKNIDLDKISSYITVNNVTKDKEASIAYYDFRISSLTRQQTALQEQLATITQSIKDYEKDSIYIFGNGTESTNTEATQASEQYDRMLRQKLSTSEELAETKQSINYYKERKSSLEKSNTASEKKSEKVQADINSVYEKTKTLVEQVTLTADDYYENVTFKNAYNILVPAISTPVQTIMNIIGNAKLPLVLFEGLLIFIYMIIVLVNAIKESTKKNIPVTVSTPAVSDEPAKEKTADEESEEKSTEEKDK